MYKLLFAFTLLVSCKDKETAFLEEKIPDFEKFARTILTDTSFRSCCIDKNCIAVELSDEASRLKVSCISKDTTEGILNFSLNNGFLEATDYIYLFDSSKEGPSSYPNAGIEIKKITPRWFVRKYGFD